MFRGLLFPAVQNKWLKAGMFPARKVKPEKLN